MERVVMNKIPTEASMSELKKCPFCGGEAHTYERHGKGRTVHGRFWFSVDCRNCGYFMDDREDVGEDGMFIYPEKECLKRWNTRADDWQPIETAPKDGTKVLILADEGKLILQGYWNIAGERWKSTNQSGHSYPILYPCHWKPLPEGPKT